jgi:hypothetical protein
MSENMFMDMESCLGLLFEEFEERSNLGQVWMLFIVEGSAHHPLLDSALVLPDHLFSRVDGHGDFHELLIEEGHASFQAPGGC